MVNEEDHYYIGLALEEAKKACSHGEVPVGAVVVHDGQVIAEAYNRRERDKDPTSHAEILAIRLASQRLNRWRLNGSTLYVTLEPCTMCMGAAILARIDRLVFGCFDPKGGAAGSLFDISSDSRLNHSIKVLSGVRESECAGILKAFFKDIRKT